MNKDNKSALSPTDKWPTMIVSSKVVLYNIGKLDVEWFNHNNIWKKKIKNPKWLPAKACAIKSCENVVLLHKTCKWCSTGNRDQGGITSVILNIFIKTALHRSFVFCRGGDSCLVWMGVCGPGGTHIFRRTGMCRSNGSLFYKKSLNMGPVF